VAVLALRSGEVAVAAVLAELGILGELEALDSGSALLGDVAHNVSNSIGLVFEVTIGNIDEAGAGLPFTGARGSSQLAALGRLLVILFHLVALSNF
jgi:hypothetical protein